MTYRHRLKPAKATARLLDPTQCYTFHRKSIDMTTVTFDTHQFIKKLEAAGLAEAQAEAI